MRRSESEAAPEKPRAGPSGGDKSPWDLSPEQAETQRAHACSEAEQLQN